MWKTFYDAHKEVYDQVLHFTIFGLIAFISMLGRPYWWAVPIAFLTAYAAAMLREWYQHGHLVLVNKDLYFGGGGAICFIVLYFIVI